MECIECRNCHQIFNSDTTQAHCFPCGHLLCLKCIKQLTALGCPLNCLLPADTWRLPSNASDFSQLNASITRRVWIDFTGIANFQHCLTQKEQELIDRQNELTAKENIIRQMREYTTDCMLLLGLPEDEMVRADHETQEARTDGFAVKLDIPASSKIKPPVAPAERASVAAWTNAAASVRPFPQIRLSDFDHPYLDLERSGGYATWELESRPFQVVPPLPVAPTLLQAGPQLQPPTLHVQRSALANVPVSNAWSSALTHRNLEPRSTMQGPAFRTSSVQPSVLRETVPPEDRVPQSQGSTSSGTNPSPPSPIRLRPLTNAERASLCDGEPYPGAATPSSGPQVPGMSGSFQFRFGSPAPASSTPPPPAQPGTISGDGPFRSREEGAEPKRRQEPRRSLPP